MPPTGAETKVQDPEYKNWLIVGLALCYLKNGLHSFIQGEVDAMHQSLLQKLHGGSAVQPQQCSSCKSKDVKQNRNTYVWKFRCPCPSRLCDLWLKELLSHHKNPTSNKIYWDNCDVTAWPFVPWECAKLYMPRGQPPSNTRPAMSDSQALLTLIANCTYFHGKLSPAGLALTHMVSKIRNSVMHSGDMKLSDSDRNSFIQDIIQLLEDQMCLGAMEGCKKAVDEINKISNASLDISFNLDLEMKALRELVYDCRKELGIHHIHEKNKEETIKSLKEEFKKLGIQLDNFAKETKDKVEELGIKYQQLDSSVTILSKTVSSEIENVKQQLSELDKKVQGVEANMSEATKPTEQLKMLKRKSDTEIGQHEKKLRKLDESQEVKASTSQATNQVSIENIESGSIKTLGSSLEDVDQNVLIRNKDLNTLKSELKSLKTRFQITETNSDYVQIVKSSFEDLKQERNQDLDTFGIDLKYVKTIFPPTEQSGEWMKKMEEMMMNIFENQKENRKLNERIGQTRGRIKKHESDNMDIHVRTKVFDYAINILHEQKHIVIQGTPGEGKTYLALSLVAELIENNKELQPVQIHNVNEWDEMIDIKRPLVVFLDDILGKYGLSETDLDRWKQISELICPNLSSSSIFLIICIRTQIVLSIKLSLQRNEALSFMFNSHVIDIGNEKHCLTKEERMEMLLKYAPEGLDRNNTVVFEDILKLKNNAIGFPQNCSMLRCRQHVDLKEIFLNNWFLVKEIQELSKTYRKTYTFLVLLMLSGGHLSVEEQKMEEMYNKIKKISNFCGLKEKLTLGEIKDIGHSLCGTFIKYKKDTKKFSFQHDCIETAVFISFGKDYTDLTLRMCSLKQLSKICSVETEFDKSECKDFLNFKVMIHRAHFEVVYERFKEGFKCIEENSFQSIAEALVWKNLPFISYFLEKITSADDMLSFLSKTDSDGQSLLTHLIYAKNTNVVQRIIRNISRSYLRDHEIVKRQLMLASTNACLAEEKHMLDNLITFQEKVDDFVMLAAASTGNVPIMEMILLQKGNINAGLCIKDINGLKNVIRNCISHPNKSSYHHDINLFHIACCFGRIDMMKYLITHYPHLVHKASSEGWTAAHFAAFSDNVELIEVLSAEQVDIEKESLDLQTVLDIAAGRSNIMMVNYLIKTWPQLIHTSKRNGITAIHYAAKGGSVPVMQALFEAGLDITAVQQNGTHVLHTAAGKDNLMMIKYILKISPQLLQQKCTDGLTAIHFAAVGGGVPVMKALLEAGLDIKTRTIDGFNVLHIAAASNNLTIVKYLIETNPELLQQTDNRGCTAMHCTAVRGSIAVMEALAETGIDITAKMNDGSHILHIAVVSNNLTVVKYLIETNPQLLQQTDNSGQTAVHVAAAGGNVTVMKALMQAGLDITAKTNHHSHVLHIAAANDNLTLVKYLIETNPELLQQTDNRGYSAMHYTAERGSVAVMEALAEAGLDMRVKTNDGFHILHIAAASNNLTLVKYLIETNPELLQQTNNIGWTALHSTGIRGTVAVMETLIQAGLDITAKTNDGSDVLHIAADSNNLTLVKYLIETNPQLLQQRDNRGCTAMHYTAARGSVAVMETLIQAGLDITAKTNDGSHVLHLAAASDNLTVVKYLIETNPQLLQEIDNEGLTVLHYAALCGSVPVMKDLIETGLDITAKIIHDSHVQHIAAATGNLTVVKCLIETNPELLQQTNNRGWTALHYTGIKGSVAVMEALIEAGLDITAKTNDDSDVLTIAATSDNLTIVNYLIETNPQLLHQTGIRGLTAVHKTAAGGSTRVMKALLQAGLDITAKTIDGSHVLHIAAANDNLKIVKYLIETNPQLLKEADNTGQTAVHYVAVRGSVPVMKALIEAGLDITAKTNDGSHVLHIAATNDNLTIVKYLIETNPQLLQQADNRGWTAVHCAAAGGSVAVMEALIEARLDITDNVLHIAAANDNLTIVKYLIEINPQLLQETDNEGQTAVHDAAAGGSVPVMKALIEAGLDITAKTNRGFDVLHIAAANDNLKIVKFLIETNPQLSQETDRLGWTAVHFASTRGNVAVMETLTEAGLDITAKSNDGCHVLHIAAANDNLTILRYLIETNPQLLQQRNKKGMTAVHCAALGGSVAVMEALIEAGLNITSKTNDGSHVLEIAAMNDNLTIVKYLIETNLQLLQQTDNRGWTAVDHTAASGSVAVMDILIHSGLDITSKKIIGSHVLHIAAVNDNLTIVKYLIEINPQLLQDRDNRGWTALHCAAAGGSVAVMEALIQAGLSITTKTSDGHDVLHIAFANDNLRIVTYLITNHPQLLKETYNIW